MNDHYCKGDIECIDAIRSALTPNEFVGYCKGNILKYVWRERYKGGFVDLAKALDYIKWAKEALAKMEVEDEFHDAAVR